MLCRFGRGRLLKLLLEVRAWIRLEYRSQQRSCRILRGYRRLCHHHLDRFFQVPLFAKWHFLWQRQVLLQINIRRQHRLSRLSARTCIFCKSYTVAKFGCIHWFCCIKITRIFCKGYVSRKDLRISEGSL